ncbi:hypothetical protein [Microbispora sp. NPDC049125]|uniref:hypothetical protein n=1 Tax=Microbispora sp. NPDC049125 TaxID=3154929 RepID=UPI0034673AA4
MGWFSNLLLPGRLRTGPTALLPARPDPKTLLAIAQLADPDARADHDDVVVGGSRIHPPMELTGDLLAKLGVEGEERLWACRVAADGPLPVDFFDKSIAEGLAYRLGGWSLCQGEPIDPAEDGRRDPVVYLPSAPSPEEVLPVLAELLRPAAGTGGWPDGELVDGIVHVPVNRGRVADVYAGADLMVTVEEGHSIPPVARARWPYLTEIAVARISPVETQAAEAVAADSGEGAQDPAVAGDERAEERIATLPEDATEPQAEDRLEGEPEGALGLEPETRARTSAEHQAQDQPGEQADDRAEDETGGQAEDGTPLPGRTAPATGQELLERGTLAMALAQRLQGIAGDGGYFQLAEPADVLPGRYA